MLVGAAMRLGWTEADETELEGLLEESVEACTERERTAFDIIHRGANGIVLLGAGKLGRRTLQALQKIGSPPIAITDNNATLWNTDLEGVPVLSPADAAQRFATSATFVVSIWRAGGTHRYEQSRAQLKQLGCHRVSSIAPLAWKHADVMLPHYCLDLPHRVLKSTDRIRSAFSLLSDDRSRAEFLAQLRFRLLADFDGLPHPDSDPQYLAKDLFRYLESENFVDVGAYDGDTLRAVLSAGGAFNSYTALEPDPVNVEALRATVASLPSAIAERIDVLPVAAHSVRQRLRITDSGSASAALVPGDAEGSGFDVECVPLDDLFLHRRMSFLKLDIEGVEPDALAGARRIIARDRPVIAVCVYHVQDHLWELPLLVRSLVDNYRFYLRPYNEEGWDLVCYGVPRERALAADPA